MQREESTFYKKVKATKKEGETFLTKEHLKQLYEMKKRYGFSNLLHVGIYVDSQTKEIMFENNKECGLGFWGQQELWVHDCIVSICSSYELQAKERSLVSLVIDTKESKKYLCNYIYVFDNYDNALKYMKGVCERKTVVNEIEALKSATDKFNQTKQQQAK